MTTDDGYMLQTNRIVTKTNSNTTKPAVLLIHGFLGYSGNYVINANSSLGFYLADNGYDVWIGNVRGTRYSKKHTSLDYESSDYWNFTWHEMAVKDIPLNIDYILNITGNKKLSYIGHSQGTTIFFALMADLPEYNDKVNVMHALAPILSGRYSNNPFIRLYRGYNKLLDLIANTFEFYVIDLEKYVTKTNTELFCASKNQFENICDIILRFSTGLSRNGTVKNSKKKKIIYD